MWYQPFVGALSTTVTRESFGMTMRMSWLVDGPVRRFNAVAVTRRMLPTGWLDESAS